MGFQGSSLLLNNFLRNSSIGIRWGRSDRLILRFPFGDWGIAVRAAIKQGLMVIKWQGLAGGREYFRPFKGEEGSGNEVTTFCCRSQYHFSGILY
jgi:hypothetical protein